MRTRVVALVLLLGVALLSAPACSSEPIIRSSGGKTAGTAEPEGSCVAEPTCEASCRNIYQTRSCTVPDGRAPCVEYCKNEIERYLPAECVGAWHELLGCNSCVELSCDAAACDGPLCGDPPYFLGCQGLSEAVYQCAGPCLREGSDASFGGDDGYEFTGSRCACPAALDPGGSEGEECTSPADCAQECCACPGNGGKFLARACQAGRCVGGGALCELDAGALFVSGFCAGEGR